MTTLEAVARGEMEGKTHTLLSRTDENGRWQGPRNLGGTHIHPEQKDTRDGDHNS